MSEEQLNMGPNVVHPEKPSALGSRNSASRHDRNEYFESKQVIDEEVDKILNHIEGKLPPEALSRLQVRGNIKELLHNYVNQSYQNMFNRYITTVEDEMAKKFRSLVTKEEHRGLNKFTYREVGELMENIAGVELFNTGEVEKSIINIYGHGQGNISRGVHDIEEETNSTLRQKMDVGALLRGQNTYALVKCAFAENVLKPEYVHDLRIVVNVFDSELVSPVHHYQVATEKLVKDLVHKRIIDVIDDEVMNLKSVLIDEGKPEMSDSELVFEKFKYLDEYVSEDKGDDAGKYAMVGQKVYEAIKGIGPKIDVEEFDPLEFRESVQNLMDEENVRNRGYNTAVNLLTGILDQSRMGYQHVENFKAMRRLSIREYSHQNPLDLPDENYAMTLEYVDDHQLKQSRIAYDQQMEEFDVELSKLGKIIDHYYKEDFLGKQQRIDFNSILFAYKVNNAEDEEAEETIWDELTFVKPNESVVEQENNNFDLDFQKKINLLSRLEHKLEKIYGLFFPDSRIVVEQRLFQLRSSIVEFKRTINPYHCHPGLLINITFSTIKRKNTTMKILSNVLNEFLFNVSVGFKDTAFAHFHRRRSTESTSAQDMESVAVRTVETNKSNEDPSSEIEGIAKI